MRKLKSNLISLLLVSSVTFLPMNNSLASADENIKYSLTRVMDERPLPEEILSSAILKVKTQIDKTPFNLTLRYSNPKEEIDKIGLSAKHKLNGKYLETEFNSTINYLPNTPIFGKITARLKTKKLPLELSLFALQEFNKGLNSEKIATFSYKWPYEISERISFSSEGEIIVQERYSRGIAPTKARIRNSFEFKIKKRAEISIYATNQIPLGPKEIRESRFGFSIKLEF